MGLFGFLSSFCSSCFSRCATSTMPVAAVRRPRPIKRLLAACILGVALGRYWLVPGRRSVLVSPPVNQPAAPTITQIRELEDLVTAKVTIADVRESNVSGYLGAVKALLVIRGDALLGPDLSQAKIVSCDRIGRVVVIELPRPHVISYRLDHTATHLVSLTHDGLWVIVPGDAGRTAVLNHAYYEAEQAVATAAGTPATINDAAQNAGHALASFFSSGGWTIRIQWTSR